LANVIGPLLYGGENSVGIAKTALDQLSRSIGSFSSKAISFLNEETTEETLNFGLFCARVVLENSCAALVGRVDSFRILYLTEFQAQPQYDIGKRAKSAFSWTGDVIPDDKASTALWNLDHDAPKISRALFSKHFEHVYWKPAVTQMVNFLSGRESHSYLSDVIAFDPDNYVNETRGISLQLYSALSKGVHWEFFTSALMFDEDTVKTLIRDTLLLVGHLDLVSHFIPTAYASLKPAEAVEAYIDFRKAVQ